MHWPIARYRPDDVLLDLCCGMARLPIRYSRVAAAAWIDFTPRSSGAKTQFRELAHLLDLLSDALGLSKRRRQPIASRNVLLWRVSVSFNRQRLEYPAFRQRFPNLQPCSSGIPRLETVRIFDMIFLPRRVERHDTLFGSADEQEVNLPPDAVATDFPNPPVSTARLIASTHLRPLILTAPWLRPPATVSSIGRFPRG